MIRSPPGPRWMERMKHVLLRLSIERGRDTMRDAHEMSGRAVIVTGGGRGIGRAIAVRFLEAGADVVICCRHAPAELPHSGGEGAALVLADARDVAQIARFVAFTRERLGRLDVLVNNAGGSPE